MVVAAIDLGTNTFHLIIADVSADELKVLYKTNLPVKLGEGRINEHIIIPEAFERGLQALETFRDVIGRYDVKLVKATATSAVRSASNGAEFVSKALERSGIAIEVISGDTEAEYIFRGVKATGLITDVSLIMDIGGGSTEFILCDTKGILWKRSFNIGAARLTQAYFHSDPIAQQEIDAINQHLGETIAPLFEACAIYKPVNLIGSAGAFETFAQMISPEMDLAEIVSSEIDVDLYRDLSGTLIRATHQDRAAMKGLIPLRVDMIVIAAILTDDVLAKHQFRSLFLSTYDLKMGVLHSSV